MAMPDGLAKMIAEDPAVFAAEVAIEATPGVDVSEVESQLEQAGVTYSVRRLGGHGLTLVSSGLTYGGPTAVEQYLNDRL